MKLLNNKVMNPINYITQNIKSRFIMKFQLKRYYKVLLMFTYRLINDLKSTMKNTKIIE